MLFHLKNGQKNELLLNLIFPDYPDGNRNTDENGAKEKETDKSVSLSSGCSYTPVMVRIAGISTNREKRKKQIERLPQPAFPIPLYAFYSVFRE